MSRDSIYKGVYKITLKHVMDSGKYWKSSITVNGLCKHVGFFETERKAAIAYDKVALRIGKPTNILKPLNG